MRGALIGAAIAAAALLGPPAPAALGGPASRTLDGSANNLRHRAWGKAGDRYLRVAAASYADGAGKMTGGPPPRSVSNRIFNDTGQNIFSESDLSQWVWAWGQFIDHDVGLRDQGAGTSSPIAFNQGDPLESFSNDLGPLAFSRTPATAGTGSRRSPRQQTNTLSSYIDASNVYGADRSRLDWLRQGPLDGDPSNNAARLILPGGYLPSIGARGDPGSAPPMEFVGRLAGDPAPAVVAGDARANENLALTAIQTLFALEHNRVVDALPDRLSATQRFAIARRIVNAEEQYVTYNEFLGAVGVALPPYRGYEPGVNAGLSNEFATVGFRLHSMVHGDFFVTEQNGALSPAQLAALVADSVVLEPDPDGVRTHLLVPLSTAFGNPGLLPVLGLAPFLNALGIEHQYRNDEQIDDSIRSVLFQVPRPGVADPGACGSPAPDPSCFTGVQDLGAIDIARGRDHGIPDYNALRRAYGLAPKRSFTAITGEATAAFPADPEIDPADPIDDPDILDFVRFEDGHGNEIALGSGASRSEVLAGTRRTTLAARLKAVYGKVGRLDAFTGMLSEPHHAGSELGELQTAIWRRQFRALRDGDRFFYLRDRRLGAIRRVYGITYRHTLAQIISLNTGLLPQPSVFRIPAAQ